MSKLPPDWQKTSVLESVFDQLSDALVLYDPEFRITGVNRISIYLSSVRFRGCFRVDAARPLAIRGQLASVLANP